MSLTFNDLPIQAHVSISTSGIFAMLQIDGALLPIHSSTRRQFFTTEDCWALRTTNSIHLQQFPAPFFTHFSFRLPTQQYAFHCELWGCAHCPNHSLYFPRRQARSPHQENFTLIQSVPKTKIRSGSAAVEKTFPKYGKEPLAKVKAAAANNDSTVP